MGKQPYGRKLKYYGKDSKGQNKTNFNPVVCGLVLWVSLPPRPSTSAVCCSVDRFNPCYCFNDGVREGNNGLVTAGIKASLIGTAIGDALGLPYENLTPVRASRILGPPDRYRLFFAWGMVSDDTELSYLVARAYIHAQGDLDRFSHSLAWGLRWWIAGLPAGAGACTVAACLKLWIGFPTCRSGVFSAGNGPAIRSAVLGAVIDEPAALRSWVKVSALITHTDPKAEHGAYAIALAAQLARQHGKVKAEDFVENLQARLGKEGEELIQLLRRVCNSVKEKEPTSLYAQKAGMENGVSGYTYQSVPVVLHAWFSHQDDFMCALTSVIRCGGDTDSTAAMLGGIMGSALGISGPPMQSRKRILEIPCLLEFLDETSFAPWDLVLLFLIRLPRNFLFLIVVLFHGFRRLLPPY